MRFVLSSLALLTLSVSNISAFTVSRSSSSSLSTMTATQRQQQIFMSSTAASEGAASTAEGDDTPLVITGNNIDLTPALTAYVEKRIGSPLNKLNTNGLIRDCDVHLSVNKNPKVKAGHRVDLTANLKGLTIHCKEETPDMYESIDKVAHALNRKLLKYKDRRVQGFHGGASMGDDLMQALEALDDFMTTETVVEDVSSDGEFIDPEAPNVMKVKSYDLETPISLKEAIFALDYVDHDFFVFKNEESSRVNVVYKRNAGGVGLIEI